MTTLANKDKYIVYSKIIYIKDFKVISEVMCNVIHEATFRFIAPNPNNPTEFAGLEIATSNVNNAMYVKITLNLQNNDCSYYCKHPIWDIGVDLVELNKLLKMNGEHDSLVIFQEEKDKKNLTLESTASKHEKGFSRLKLVDPNRKKRKPLSPDFTFQVTLRSKFFTSFCKNLSNLASYVEIKCTSNTISFTCKGDTSDNGKILKSSEEKDGVKIYLNEELKNKPNENHIYQGIFDLSNLALFTKFSSLNSNVNLFLKNDSLLIIEYVFAAQSGKAVIAFIPINEDNIGNCNCNYSEDEDDDVKEITDKLQHVNTAKDDKDDDDDDDDININTKNDFGDDGSNDEQSVCSNLTDESDKRLKKKKVRKNTKDDKNKKKDKSKDKKDKKDKNKKDKKNKNKKNDSDSEIDDVELNLKDMSDTDSSDSD